MPPPDEAGLNARMEAARQVIETKFLAASDVLAEAIDGIAALVTALDEMGAAVSPETIAATSRQLDDAAAKLSALPEQHFKWGAAITELAGQQAVLGSGLEEMRRSLAYMRAFTVSIKITAAGIAGADAEFGVFAQEISARVAAGSDEVAALERGLAALHDELQAASGKSATLTDDFAGIIPAVPEQLAASAQVMAAHRGRIAAATAQAAALARDVRKTTGRILGALQIGDISRQRVEHVQTGAALMALDDPALSEEQKTRMRAIWAALLAAQLAAAERDFSHEVAEISAGLTGLAGDAASLMGLRALASGDDQSDSGGVLKALEAQVAAAAGKVAAIEAAAALAQATGRHAAAAARQLSDRLDAVQAMKSDVFFMAMNTTLKSARLGDVGRPLSTIAVELRSHAEALDATAAHCVSALTVLTQAAAELAGDENQAEGAGAALQAAVAQIKLAGETTARDVATLVTQGEAVLALLTRSTGQLTLRQEIGEILGQVAAELTALAQDAAPCGADIAAPMAALFGQLGKIYTMAQEREVHAAVAAQWGVSVPAAVVAAVDEFEDALF